MIRRVLAGILGGVVGALPLFVVNVLVNGAGTFGAVESAIEQNVLIYGAGALLGGMVLGGVAAGWVAGRRGGAVAGGVAGAIAALLYALIVILFIVGGAKQGWGPPIAALHPIRTSAAICLVATLLLGIALLTGALVGRDATPEREQRGAASSSHRSAGTHAARTAWPEATPRQPSAVGALPTQRDAWREPVPPPRSPAGARPRVTGSRSQPRDRR